MISAVLASTDGGSSVEGEDDGDFVPAMVFLMMRYTFLVIYGC